MLFVWVANSCKAGNAIEVSWNDNYGYDYEPFPIQVENTCRFCDAHNVILHLQIFCINLNSDPVDEKVIVNNGKSIHPGQELTFTYSVNCQASIQSAQATAEFINCI